MLDVDASFNFSGTLYLEIDARILPLAALGCIGSNGCTLRNLILVFRGVFRETFFTKNQTAIILSFHVIRIIPSIMLPFAKLQPQP